MKIDIPDPELSSVQHLLLSVISQSCPVDRIWLARLLGEDRLFKTVGRWATFGFRDPSIDLIGKHPTQWFSELEAFLDNCSDLNSVIPGDPDYTKKV